MAKIGRPRAEVVLTEDERLTLVRLTKRVRVNRAIAFRARIVLACAKASDTAVAQRLRTTKTTVAKWRSQFVADRLAGLYDEPRVGAPRTITDEAVEAIIVKTLETTPPGETHWSTRSMAKAAGISHAMVGRIWRTFRLQPHRAESFKLSPDPQLVEKIRDVVGLYITPPANAVVFSVDEKSQIQALQRAQPILPMDVGQPERRTHNTCGMARSTCLPPSTLRPARCSPNAPRSIARRTSSRSCGTLTRASNLPSTSMSCSTISPRTVRRPSSAGSCAILACNFTSPRPTRRG
jgi:transposase